MAGTKYMGESKSILKKGLFFKTSKKDPKFCLFWAFVSDATYGGFRYFNNYGPINALFSIKMCRIQFSTRLYVLYENKIIYCFYKLFINRLFGIITGVGGATFVFFFLMFKLIKLTYMSPWGRPLGRRASFPRVYSTDPWSRLTLNAAALR